MMIGWLKHQNQEEPNEKAKPNTATDYRMHKTDVNKCTQKIEKK
jgi:hypothetical protein